MRIFKDNEELKKEIVNGEIIIDDDIQCDFNIDVDANIKAWNIKAWNIKAEDINAWDIKAWNIIYYAVCFAYKNIKCTKIEGKRKNSKHFCLDGEIEIIEKQDKVKIEVEGKQIYISRESAIALNLVDN